MEAIFHCERKGRRKARKSKHRVLDTCDDLVQVLTLNPQYGVLISGTNGLRKMRINVPGLQAGKSGGYRLIYRAEVVDEVWHIIFMATYFKGEIEDLSKKDYRELSDVAEQILSDTLSFDWDIKSQPE